MKKNVASQIVSAQLVSKTDGSDVTSGTTTVYVTGDGGTQATGTVGSGAATHEGNGTWTYAPSQAETNFDQVTFTFVNSNAVTACIQIYTSFPQTGDSFARLGAPAGASVSADVAAVKVDTAAILVDTGTTLDAKIDAIDAVVDAILVDTAEIGVAGAGLTNINLPDQTMNITGNITGNLSGSVGSVTGSVGSIAAGGIASTSFAAGAITNSVLAANAISAAILDPDVATELWARTVSDLSAVPAANAAVIDAVSFLFMKARNRTTQTSTENKVYKDDASTVMATSTVSDDGTTATRGEFA